MNKDYLIIGAIVIVLYMLYTKQQTALAAQKNAATTAANNSPAGIINGLFSTLSSLQIGGLGSQGSATGDISDY